MRMKFYIYLHRRPDTGAVFYVGRGKHYTRSTPYRRAYSVIKRNAIWQGIVDCNNGQFIVEILLECFTANEVNQLEREAVAAFGKIIDGTGTLCNLTEGGEGVEGFSHSEEAKTKMALAHKQNPSRAQRFKSAEFIKASIEARRGLPGSMQGKRHSDIAKAKMSFARKGAKHYAAKSVIDISNGSRYGCVEDAAEAISVGKWYLYKMLKGHRINHTSMRYENGV
jgi:hypothetical protein